MLARSVKPREQQLARPEAHHVMRVDYQRFTDTRITSLPFTLFFDGEDPTPRRQVVEMLFLLPRLYNSTILTAYIYRCRHGAQYNCSSNYHGERRRGENHRCA